MAKKKKKSMSTFARLLKIHLDAGYPALLVRTSEYARLEREILDSKNGRQQYFWNAAEGMIRAQDEATVAGEDPLEAIQYVAQLQDPALVVLRDFHHYYQDPQILAYLQSTIAIFKQNGSAILLASCGGDLPPEIKNEVTPLEFKLPDEGMLRQSLHGIYESAKETHPDLEIADETVVLNAAKGMSTIEAENAFSKSIVEFGKFDPDSIVKSKMAALEEGSALRFYETQESLDSVGGLKNLKEWLRKRKKAFSKEAKKYGLRTPRGVLIIGVAGTGKSLCAKATSAAWGLPLLHFDVGSVFGSLVGESEAAMRQVQERAEAMAPVILWIDELEKAFAGMGGDDHDGGTSRRVFGGFLTWLQEKKAEVAVIATSNDVTVLPPELLRKGRFDEIFFVDLPTAVEREEIAKIHIKKRGRKSKNFDLPKIVKATDGYTGSEIEEAINDAMFNAFDDKEREFSADDVEAAAKATMPLSKVMAEQIQHLRDWAKGRARRASDEEARRVRGSAKRKLGGIDPGTN